MTSDAVDLLRNTRTIRERCSNVLRAIEAGAPAHFRVHPIQIDNAAAVVAELTRCRFPDLLIPYHSRWRHFEAGSRDRHATLSATLDLLSPDARARSEIDLAVVSVLLDAGAGADWRYHETGIASPLSRSEGLGVAAWHAFVAGAFSADPADPLRVDAARLESIDARQIERIFQVAPDNPLVGVEGRAQLLRRLGAALRAHPEWFGAEARPGGLFDALTDGGRRVQVDAHDILRALLFGLASIWPSDNLLDGEPLGDVWRHPLAGGEGPSAGWVPFHKLSQWLTYSLLEPFERAGVTVIGLERLTALAEYRNGGLLIDAGVIEPTDPTLPTQALTPAHPAVIEWRALTIALLDPLAERVRERLGTDANTLPLAKVLEGGTWAAGRVLASRLRDGSPPLTIVSDGTVF